MNIDKCSRHSKIAGDFGELLLLYWLSKYGFESARIDHTGIDLLARNPHNKELMGISVKNRTRNLGAEKTVVNIPNTNIEKLKSACRAFECIPYFAIIVDADNLIRAFLLPMPHLLKLFPMQKRVVSWKMTQKHLEMYYQDPKIKIFELKSQTLNWW